MPEDDDRLTKGESKVYFFIFLLASLFILVIAASIILDPLWQPTDWIVPSIMIAAGVMMAWGAWMFLREWRGF